MLGNFKTWGTLNSRKQSNYSEQPKNLWLIIPLLLRKKKKKRIFTQFGMLSKSKEPETLLTEDISCSLVLDEAFLQHGLEEKNVKIESPATKRKMTLNIQIQLWIILFFHLKATNDLLKKMSVPMLETFQRECVEPPPIRISDVKHKAHSFTLSIKRKQPTSYSAANWEAHILKILRRINGWSKQAPVPEVKQRHGIMPKARIWCKHIMGMKSQSANKYLQRIPTTSCNGLSNRLASCLHTGPCATKSKEGKPSPVSSCTHDGNMGPENVFSNWAFLTRISRHRAEGRKWDGPEQQISCDLGWGSSTWEDKGEAGEWMVRGRCKVLPEFRMFAGQCAPCCRNTLQHIRNPSSPGWVLKKHLHCLFHHLQNTRVFSSLL